MFKILSKFLNPQRKTLDRYQTIVQQIHSFDAKLEKLDDEDLAKRTQKLRDRLRKGESLDAVLPESFAFSVCRIEPENNIHVILEAF